MMGRKRGYAVLSLLLFLIGLFFLDSSKQSLTGAFLGVAFSPGASSFIGVILMISAGIIFMAGNLEEEVKRYDPNIKSLRRWLEKREHRIIEYKEAEKIYNALERRYWDSVGKRRLKRGDQNQPLKFIERYIETHKEIESRVEQENHAREKIRAKAEELLNEADRSLAEGRIYTRRNDLIRLATRLGYNVTEERTEGIVIKSEDTIITVIPRHREINKLTAKAIMKAMASKKSFLRKEDD